jgi:hypothetical protein
LPWHRAEISRTRTEKKKGDISFCLMDGRASLEEIAHKLAAEFPQRFSSMQEALSYAGQPVH